MGVLAERGYENTRFADVSAASGVAVSTLQNYFGSREDMLIEALRRATGEEAIALDAVAAAGGDPWKRLVALIDRSLGTSERSQQILMEFWRSSMRDEELREYSEEMRRRYREPFLNAVAEGVAQGTFEPAHDPGDVVDLLIAALTGMTVAGALRRPGPAAEGLRRVLLAQLGSGLGLRD